MLIEIIGFMKVILTACFLSIIGFLGNAFSQGTQPSDTTQIEYIEPTVGSYPLSCIEPPSGFEIMDGVNGYVNKNTSSTILVQLIDGVNYINIEAGLTPEHWASENVSEVSKESFTTSSGLNGLLYKLSFNVNNTDMFRYMLITGELSKTVWINITYPAQFDALISPEALKSLKSVHLVD